MKECKDFLKMTESKNSRRQGIRYTGHVITACALFIEIMIYALQKRRVFFAESTIPRSIWSDI